MYKTKAPAHQTAWVLQSGQQEMVNLGAVCHGSTDLMLIIIEYQQIQHIFSHQRKVTHGRDAYKMPEQYSHNRGYGGEMGIGN